MPNISSILRGSLPSVSVVTSPKRNAFFSRLALFDTRFLCVLPLGGDLGVARDWLGEEDVSSDSSIQAKDDCARVERVGTAGGLVGFGGAADGVSPVVAPCGDVSVAWGAGVEVDCSVLIAGTSSFRLSVDMFA